MMEDLAWAVRPKWHRFESPRSYMRRQCQAAGVPLSFVERGLKLKADYHRYTYQVWADEAEAAATMEAAAGRPAGHYLRLKQLAQPDPEHEYQERFLCRLCAAGDRVEQIPHDRENWCLRHAGQMVWTGPGSTPDTQLVVPYDDAQAKAERRFRRLVNSSRVKARLHARVWEMVRDNAWLTAPEGWSPALAQCLDDHEVRGRAALYVETVAVLAVLSEAAIVTRWASLPPPDLRRGIVEALPSAWMHVSVLVERIVLWLRPMRRELRPTRIDPLDIPLDIVDTPAIIDITAPYPLWIQRHPHAVAEWAWRRNDQARDPWESRGTSVKAWWVCDTGHAWETTPYLRAISGCPYCAGQAAWLGLSDLGTQYPELAAEWDRTPGANAGDPDHVSTGSRRRINWVCQRGHRWVAEIQNRTRLGAGCPFCAGQRAIPGETDLATLRPDLAAQWNHERNGELTPHTIGAATIRKVWWKGPCGHEWQASISNRTRGGTGCPYCARKRPIPGLNDLATVRPDLAAQWDTSNTLRPDEVLPSAGKKVTWRCARGHVWEAAIYSRSHDGRGCPYCSGRRPVVGESDLATLRPDLINEWDPSNKLQPHEVTAHSKMRATWRCADGHVWKAIVQSRTSRRGTGCPTCRGKRPVTGQNDLATLRPDLAAQWDTSNSSRPDRVKPTSRRKVTWKCTNGHTWVETVISRSHGSGCPECESARSSV
ncbi:zinc-ribbon domain-containing protein [Microbacterium capsulatum]|uniref:Zinc-ribbon domain-containing protein n=1 Tax=Microbacterium capsulatum TaxID=3041921 RepID=A0ABU0XLR7_9MICO|nr:zinc-ribbon domain-containing protein [Microbacterium sp. ASV81]MDQ4215055.1 zinc-ribbon domain-containing protein [Microbacterium sp. ASV81]